jgi:ATP-dependent helicase/nuclease subunit A
MAKQPSLFDLSEPGPDPEAMARSTPEVRQAPPPDQPARDFAVDPREHVVLEASAGTGKTRVLVDRYVRLIEAGVDPKHILAMTFTRKAAAEMRDRVVTELRRQATESPRMAARWAALEDHLTDVNILTIDAFCFGLLREFPLEADVDPAFEIADETEMARYVNEAIDLTFRAARSLLARDEHVRLLFAKVRLNGLRGALAQLLDRRHVAMPALASFVVRHAEAATTAAIARAFVERVGRVVSSGLDGEALLNDGPVGAPEFVWLLRDLEALADPHADLAADLTGADSAVVRRFRGRLEDYFLTGNKPRKQAATRFKHAFPSPVAKKRHDAAIRQLAPGIEAALDALDRDINALVARGLQRLFAMAIQKYEALLDDHAVLDFVGMLDHAVRLLERQEEFARSRLKLQSRYHHVLVDELQDTSRVQWRLIELLVHAWREGEGPEDTQPSIFVVGDRKQSIYRFRQAEVTVLDEAARFIGGLRPGASVRRAITHSFRAVPELLAFVNALAVETQSSSDLPERFVYTDRDRFPVPAMAPGALRDGEPVLGLVAAASMPECAEAVAAEVARVLASVTVRDREGPPRNATPEDIAILFRVRAGHQHFERALEVRGIRTYVYKGLGFFDAPEVQDLQALIRYLAEPESNLRAAECLRSRFVRLSDAGLLALAPNLAEALNGSDPPATVQALNTVDAALLDRARSSMRRWLALVDRIPPAELIDLVIGESAYVFEWRGRRLAQSRENAKKVRSLVRRVQNRGYTTMRRLADYFSTLKAGDESNAIIEAAGAVNLMTMHAAKGLEFPIVFLVNLQQPGRGAGAGVQVITDGPDGESDVAIGMSSAGTRLEAARDDEELRRVLYVAVTRARDRLYLAAALKDGRFDRRRASLGALMPAALRALFVRAAAEPTGETAALEWTSASGGSFTFRQCPVPPPDGVAAAAITEGFGGPVDVAPLVLVDRSRIPATSVHHPTGETRSRASVRRSASARLAGTVVHRLLQRRVGAVSIDEATRVARTLIGADEAADVDDRDALAAEAAATFLQIRVCPDIATLMETGTCHYEVPFSYRPLEGPDAPEMVIRGTIDCLVETIDGRLIVLEFKTGQPRAEHDAQLAVYREALAVAMPGRTVEARLIYPARAVFPCT